MTSLVLSFLMIFLVLAGCAGQDDEVQVPDNTNKDEMIDKFILGREPMEKFDEFVDRINSMGIDDVLKVLQDAYDRYNR